MKKQCHKCKSSKLVEEFPKNKTKKDGRSETCLECKRQYNKKHYQANVEYYVAKAARYAQKMRAWLVAYKVERGCSRCPENHPGCLHFHHRDPEYKQFDICDGLLTRAKNVIEEEIAKCDVLCANCHGKHHWDKKNVSGV